MFKEIQDYAEMFSYNGKKWISEITTASQELRKASAANDNINISREDVLKKMAPQIEHIFREEIISALERCVEFSRVDIYGDHLLTIVSGNAYRIVEPFLLGAGGYAGSRKQMELVAGDIDDFYSGVLFAREILTAGDEGKRKLSPEQKAAFWKKFVWPTGLYEETVETRFERWNDKAPYWIFLDQGNATYDLAYPNFYGTNFLWAALTRIQAAFDTNLLEEEAQYSDAGETLDTTQIFDDAVSEVVIKFLQNPDYYNKGEILMVYYDKVKKRYYDIYVTKSRGVLGKKLHRGAV